MLLRKPFALLIKYFKLIHFILTGMIVYLLLRTNRIFVFLGEYISSNSAATVPNISKDLFSTSMILTIIGILILTFIILGLMSFKKKPIWFYIYNIIVYGCVAGLFIYSYSIIHTLEIGLVGIPTLKIIRDLTMLSLILQSVSVLVVGIRATGFNIKKFDFDQDLEDLQVTEADREEFEVDVELDTDRLRRNFKKQLRHIKYVYIENKFIITMISLLVIAGICFTIYLNVGVYHNVYRQNKAFTTSEFMMNITNSYVTNLDYHGDIIVDDKKLVVVEYQVRNIYQVNKKTMKPERFSLMIGNQSYAPIETYSTEFSDIGKLYRSEFLNTKFQTYIMVYEIPKTIANSKMILNYEDINQKEIEIALSPIDDTKRTVVGAYPLSQGFEMNDPIMKGTYVRLENYEINDSFQAKYSYCVLGNCTDGIEYIVPSTTDNYEKTLLKLKGSVVMAENINFETQLNLYLLMRDYGTIYYTIGGETKKMHTYFRQVRPNKAKEEEIYYLEVKKELKDAEKITISFTIRNEIYEIVVK